MVNMQTDSELLKNIRQKNRLSQPQLAEILGCSKQYISQVESGRTTLSKKYFDILNTKFELSSGIQNNDDCLSIPVRGDITASMGYGVTIYDEKQTGTYQISSKLANDLGINPQKTEMIFASGDSMLPTIEGGDSLLIDLNRKEIYDGRIYCVRIDGQLYAKRLQKIPPSKVIVISDNQKYQSFEIDFSKQIEFDFEVIGEVRWWGRVAR